MIKVDWISGLFRRHRPQPRGRQSQSTGVVLRTVEVLEERQMLTAVSWIATTDGFWDVGANWSTGVVPTSNDDVTLDLAGSDPVITVRDDRTVKSLVSRESLVITAGNFRIDTTTQIDASTTTLSGGGFVAIGVATMTDTGTFDWQDGGTFFSNLVNNGTIEISAAADVRLAGTLNNNALITHSGAGSLLFDGSTRLNNNAGGVYDFAGDGDIGRSGFGAGFNSFFQNDGTVRKSAGAGISTFNTLTLNNGTTAAVDVDSGRLNVSSDGTWGSVALTGTAGAVFEISGNFVVTGTLSASGAGNLELTGSITSSGSDAKLNFPVGYFQWTTGVISGPGTGFESLGTLNISGSGNPRVAGQLTNKGTITHSGEGVLQFDGSTRLNIASTGVFEFDGDGDIGRSPFGAGFGPFIQNDGTLRKIDGTGVSRIETIDLNVTATGKLEAQTGTLQIATNGSWSGATLNAATDAAVEIVGTSITVEGAMTGAGAGQVRLASGQFHTNSNGATLNFPTGLLHWTGSFLTTSAPLVNTGTLQISGDANRSVAGFIMNQGTIVHSGAGDIIDVAGGGGSRFDNEIGGVYEFQGDDGNVTFSTFNNKGTILKSSGMGESRFIATNGDPNGFISFNNLGGTITVQTGTLRLARGSSTGGTFNASVGAILDVTGGGQCNFEGTYTGSGGGRVEHTGGNINSINAGVTVDFPDGLFHWTGGGIAGNGGGFRNEGFIALDGANGKGLSGNNFINNGTMVNSGPGEFGLGAFFFINSATGIFEQRGDSPLGGTDQFGNPGRFINNGLFWKSAGSGTVSWNGRLENGATGVIDVDAGSMTFARGGTSTGGTFLVSAGTKLGFSGNDTFNWSGTFTGTGPGDIEFNSLLSGGDGTINGTLNFPEGMFHMISGQLLGGIVNVGWFDFAPTAGLFARAGITNNGTWTHSGAGDFVLNANSRFINNGLYDLQTDADLVVPGDASGGSMFFVNTPTGVFRKSGGLGTSTLRHDGTGKELRFDNAGTVEVQTGTVEFIDTVVQFSGSTLTGGEWIAREFSTISAPSATNFTTNSGRVTLDGLGSSFARINTIATNNGSFAVTGGRDFATVGNLTNTGEITVGSESELTVTGSLTETSVGRLVGWWRGEDNALDSAGTIHGTLNGDTSFDDGEFGDGFHFNGNRDFVSLGNPTALRLQDFTIAAWVKRDAATQALIFGYGQNGYGLGMFADGKLFLTNVGISHVQTSNLQITDNEFHHVAVTKSGGSVTFYVDGVAEVVAPYSTTFNFFTNAAIGARADAAGSDFDGVIDEVAVFSRPLSSDEIQALRDNNNPAVIGAPPAAINIQIEDRPGTGRFGKLIVTGPANFTGAIGVALVGGFGPVLADAYTVMTYASQTGSFFPATGISPFFDIAINPTQTILTVVASSADLGVQSVSVPPTASPGDSVTINYTVVNSAATLAVGSWTDSIYLSFDDRYDASDLLIGRVEHTGGLGPSLTYNGSLTATLPGVIDGNYHVIVIADSRGHVGDSNRADNERASTNKIAVDLPILAYDTATPLTISPDQDIYLRLEVPIGGDITVTADFLSALQAEFFIRQGALPTRSDFDFVASDLTDLSRTITLASPEAGPYYILFHGREGATGGVGFTVLAENIEFDLQTVSPSRGSNQGRATTILTGAGFTDETIVELLNGSGGVVATAATRVINQNRLYATFDLVGVASDLYAVRASRPGFSETLPAAYHVVVGQPGDVRVEIITPGSVRAGRIYTGYIDYQNIGDTDVVPPLIFVVSSSAITFDLTKDPSILEDRFLAVSPDGPAGILAPGQSVRIPFRFFGNNMSIQALTMSPDETATMDWEQLRAEIRPDIPPAGWDAMFDQQFVSAGTTVGDYVHLLAETATLYQTRNGTTTRDPDELHRFLMHEGFLEQNTDIRGTVYLDDDTRLQGGVTVIALDETTGVAGTAMSTADGLVRIPNLPAGTYTLTFVGFLPPNDLQQVVVPANGSAPTQTWIVRTGGSIKGRVGAPDGIVITDENHNIIATVLAIDEAGNEFTASVDENHVYQFRGLPAGTYDVSFSTPTTLPVFAHDIVVTEGFTTGLIDLFSQAGGSVTGTVTRDGGIPVAGIYVVTGDPDNPQIAVTNSAGQYRLDGITPGQVTVSTNASGGFADVSVENVTVTSGQTTTAVNLLVHFNLGSVSGTITADGQAVPNTQVSLLDDEGNLVKFDLTGSNGNYSLGDIVPGTYTLQVDAFGFVPVSQEVAVDPDEDLDLDVSLVPAGTVTGQVRILTPSGQLPAVNLPLRLTLTDGTLVDLQADNEGRYGVSNLTVGDYSIALADGSHATDFEITDTADPVQVDIVLSTGLIHGHVVIPGGGPIAESGLIVTARADGQVIAAVAAEANGDFSFPMLSPGTYDLAFDMEDVFLSPVNGVVVIAGTINDLGNITSQTASLSVTIRDKSNNLPIAAEGLLFAQQLIADDLSDSIIVVDVSPGGIANLSNLVPGQYVLRPMYVGQESPQVVVTVNQGANSADITLGEAGNVVGTITDGTNPLGGITVTLYLSSSPDRSYQTITAADGTYDVDLLPDGDYTAVFADLRPDAGESYLGFAEITGITVTEGQVTTQNAVLTPGTASLEVTVEGDTQASPASTTPITTRATLTTADGIPIAVTIVALRSAGANQTFVGLPTGNYTLTGNAPGFLLGDEAVTVSAGVNSATLDAIWRAPAGNALPEENVAPFSLLSLDSFEPESFSLDYVIQSAHQGAANLKRMIDELLGIFPERRHPMFAPPAIPHPPDHCPEVFPLWRAVSKAIHTADEQLSGWQLRYQSLKETLLSDALDIGAAIIDAAISFTGAIGKLPVVVKELQSTKSVIKSGVYGGLDVIEHTLVPITKSLDEIGGILKVTVDTLIGAAKDPTKVVEQVPGVSLAKSAEEAVNAFFELSEATTIDQFFASISKFSTFIAEVGAFSAKVVTLVNLINGAAAKIPVLLAVADPVDKAASILKVVATSLGAVGNTLGNVSELKQNKERYDRTVGNVLDSLNAYLKALEDCDDDDDEDDTDKPKQPLTPEDLKNLAVVVSSDPNDIVGPDGSGAPDHFMRVDQNFPYMVLFENKPEATAPAQEVVITQQLDTDLDWFTFELGDFGFGDLIVDVPEGRNFYETRIDLRDTLGFFVDFSAGINLQTGVVTWQFTSIDPETGDLVDDALAGFLPPNDASGRGQGFVEYSIDPDGALTTGGQIDAQASIVFDTNEPLLTPVYVNKIDTGAPTSTVTPLAPTQEFPNFTVSWSGTDDAAGPTGSGIATFDIYVSDNGGPFEPFLLGTPLTSAVFHGQINHAYSFYSVATDKVGFHQPTPESGQTSTNVLDVLFDLGDAPDPFFATPGHYPTLLANDGPRHRLGSGLFLGTEVDREFDGQPSANADGDDVNGTPDDEDGVVIPGLVRGSASNVTVTASQAGKLDAWIDFNRDGDWDDADERIANSLSVNAGSNTINVAVPSVASIGATYARFRLSSAGGLAVTGEAADGEVEDVQVQIQNQLLFNFGSPVIWIKKDPPVVVLPVVFVSNGNLANGVLTVSVDAVGSARKLLDTFTTPSFSAFGTSSGPAFVNGKLTLQIQLNGSATATAIQTFLRSITFETKGKGLKRATRTVEVTLANSSGASTKVTQTINVFKKPVNTAPAVSAKGGHHK